MKILRAFYILCSLCLLPAAVHAEEMAPDALVKKVTDEVLTVIRTDKDLQSGNTKKAAELVETKVLPHFNFTRMTALALGREWSKVGPEQRSKLTAEFRTLLVRTYSNALTAYKDQSVEYKPFKMQAGETDVLVRTLVRQGKGKDIGLDYALEKQADGWKVYDVVVAGVSLVTNYRDSFTQEIRANGVDGLIASLAAKNKGLDASAGKK